jgi:carboxymethylenebutenolidase
LIGWRSAVRTFILKIMSKDISLEAAGKAFPAYVVEPAGEAKAAVIVIQEIWWLTPHIKDICDRVAAEGYLVLGPNLLSETNIEELVDDELAKSLFDPKRRSAVQPQLRAIMAPIQAPDFAEGATKKLQACYEYLAQKVGDNVAVMGFCFGGTYSFQLAVTEPKLKAAVPFYGHAHFSAEQLSAITCPILAFYGEKDESLIIQLPELKDSMRTAGVDFNSIVYPDCGHAFFNDTNEFAYNAAAAADAWQKTLEFLKANLALPS